MVKIGLISDTHNFLDENVFRYFENCDEIWHAGDFGSIAIAEQLEKYRPLKGVYGNIDGYDIRSRFPYEQVWTCEKINIYMTHIGGYPGKYAAGIKQKLMTNASNLFICGHSHILKIMFDEKIRCLHMNPGAAGNQGWHKLRTLIRFSVDNDQLKDCEVIRLGQRG